MAVAGLKDQTQKMLKTSSASFPAAKVGNSIRVRVPDVDPSMER